MAVLQQDLQVNTALVGITWTEVFVALVNDRRAYYGLPPYKVATQQVYDAYRADIAQAHAVNMEATQWFAHDADVFPTGARTFDERALKMGLRQSAENILVMELRYNHDSTVPESSPGAYPSWAVNIPPVILNDWTFPTPREAFEAWWNSPGHRENLLRDYGEGQTEIYSMVGIEIGEEAITDGRYLPAIPFDPPFDTNQPMVWFCNVMINLEPAVLEQTFHLNSSITGANLLTQSITFRLDTMNKVLTDFTDLWSIRLCVDHETQYSARVAAQHEAPIFYSVATDFEANYTQTVPIMVGHSSDYRIRSTVDVPMSLDAQYSMTLSVVHQASYEDSGHTSLAHEAGYADVPHVLTTHGALYGEPVRTVVDHLAGYGEIVRVWTQAESAWSEAMRIPMSHAAYYDDMAKPVAVHTAPYSSPSVVSADNLTGYNSSDKVYSLHEAEYTLNLSARTQLEASYAMTLGLRTSHQGLFDMSVLNHPKADHRAFWASPSGATTIVTPSAMLTLASGRQVPLTDAVVSLDESSYAWQARIRLNVVADFTEIQREDAITLTLAGEAYTLVVTSKSLGRPKVSEVDMVVAAVSPTIRLDAPRAATISIRVTDSAYIHDIAEAVAGGPVNWLLPNWMIPANRIQFDGLTPMAVLQKLASVVGGVVQTERDGSITVRPLFPVTVSKYKTAAPDHIITDADGIFSVSEEYEYHEGFSRFRIREGEATYGDRLEWVPDKGALPTGILRVMPSPMRSNFTIDCTDQPDVTIFRSSGMISREETEVVEFKGGTANMAYPVYEIKAVEWMSSSLGDLVFEQASTSLSGALDVNEGYGLAKITYVTQVYEYAVTGVAGSMVQFIMKEA